MPRRDEDDEDFDRDDDVDVKRKKRKRGDAEAAGRLAGPAICLMVVASLHLALSCIALPLSIFLMVKGPAAFGQGPGADMGLAASPVQNLISSILGLAVQGFILFGAIQMKGAKMYGVSMATAILSVIPCFCSSCGILGMPFGIWALILLMDADVKSAFTS